uniref:Uncharacterized protein n=1 Tax=Arion vulgaris TaxID=1028688 RepID=A0A0B7BDJ4_9EUPU
MKIFQTKTLTYLTHQTMTYLTMTYTKLTFDRNMSDHDFILAVKNNLNRIDVYEISVFLPTCAHLLPVGTFYSSFSDYSPAN